MSDVSSSLSHVWHCLLLTLVVLSFAFPSNGNNNQIASDLEASLASLKGTVDAQVTDLESLRETVNAQAADLVSLKGLKENVDAQATDTESLRETVDVQAADLESLKALKENFNAQATDLGSLTETVDVQAADLENLKALKETVGVQTTHLESLTETVDAQATDLESLKAMKETVDAQAADLVSLKGAKEIVDAQATDLIALKEIVDAQATDLESLRKTVESLAKDMGSSKESKVHWLMIPAVVFLVLGLFLSPGITGGLWTVTTSVWKTYCGIAIAALDNSISSVLGFGSISSEPLPTEDTEPPVVSFEPLLDEVDIAEGSEICWVGGYDFEGLEHGEEEEEVLVVEEEGLATEFVMDLEDMGHEEEDEAGNAKHGVDSALGIVKLWVEGALMWLPGNLAHVNDIAVEAATVGLAILALAVVAIFMYSKMN